MQTSKKFQSFIERRRATASKGAIGVGQLNSRNNGNIGLMNVLNVQNTNSKLTAYWKLTR